MLRVLYDPDSFFSEYKDGFKIPIAIVSLSGVIGAIISYLNLPKMIEMLQQFPIERSQMEIMIEIIKIQAIVSPIIGAFVGWILITLIVHALSALFGGEGNLSNTLKYTSFSFLPQIVLSPLSYYYYRPTPTAPLMILGLANTIWQAYILVFALKHARRIETSKAVICVAIPIVIAYALSFIGFLLLR